MIFQTVSLPESASIKSFSKLKKIEVKKVKLFTFQFIHFSH